jgi:hypothetical protein
MWYKIDDGCAYLNYSLAKAGNLCYFTNAAISARKTGVLWQNIAFLAIKRILCKFCKLTEKAQNNM